MPRNVLSSMVISLALDAARFTDGLTKSEFQAKKTVESIKNEFERMQSAVLKIGALLGVGFGIDAFAGMIKGSIAAQANLQKLGDQAGITGEQFSAFIASAARSQTELQDVALMSARLSKALIEGKDATSKAAIVLRELGITGKDTARLLADPVAAVVTVAKAMQGISGGTAAAAQLLLLGRSGGTTSHFLRELAEQQTVQASRSQEQILAAKHLEDQFVDLQLRTNALKTDFANGLVPTLSDVAKVLKSLGEGAGSAKEQLGALIGGGEIQAWARDAVIAISTILESLTLVLRGMAAFAASVNVIRADIKTLDTAGTGPNASMLGRINFAFANREGRGQEALAITKKLLEEQNEAVADANKKWSDLWNKRVDFMSDAFRKQFAASDAAKTGASAGLFSDRSFAAGQKRAEEEAEAIKKRNKAVQDALDRGSKSGAVDKTVSDAKRYIEALEKQLEKTEELTVLQTVLRDIEKGRFVASGAFSEAEAIRLAKQLDAIKSLAAIEAAALKIKEDHQAKHKAFAKTAEDEAKSIELSNEAMRHEISLIGLDAKGVLELEQARVRDVIAQRQSLLAKREAEGAYGNELDAIRAQIDALTVRSQLLGQKSFAEQIAQDAAELKDFKGAVFDNMIDPLTDFITGTKTAEDAFRQFVSSVNRMITQLALNSLKDSLLGTTTGPDFGKIVAGLVGSFTGGGSSSGFGMNVRDSGGPVSAGVPYKIGVPEYFVSKTAGNIIPLHGAKAPVSNVFNVNVMPGASRESADQAGARLAMQVRRAQRIT